MGKDWRRQLWSDWSRTSLLAEEQFRLLGSGVQLREWVAALPGTKGHRE